MHTITGRWKLGLALALTTAVFWGVLPIALKVALQGMDVYSITWYRFAVSAVLLGVILAATRGLPKIREFRGRKLWTVLLIALAGLVGNYLLYLAGLDHATPTVTQTVIQLGPIFLLLGGLFVFHERFSPLQWLGFAVLIAGLLLFFNRRLPELMQLHSGLGLGVLIVVLAALVWAFYGLAQKQLLKHFSSQQILLVIYIGAAIVLLPTAHLGEVLELSALQFWMLAFSCLNTLIAYGAFAAALEHWEMSRVGAVLSTAPLFTLVSMWVVEHYVPGLVEPEGLNLLSVVGALLVVAGSAASALANASPRAPAQVSR